MRKCTGKNNRFPILDILEYLREYPQKSKIWKSETSPNQGTWLGIPWLGLASLCQIWDFVGILLNTLKYLILGICYFFLWCCLFADICKWLDAPVFSDEDENCRQGTAHYTFTDLTLLRRKRTTTGKWLARYLTTSGNDQPKCLSFQNCGRVERGGYQSPETLESCPFLFSLGRSVLRKTSK